MNKRLKAILSYISMTSIITTQFLILDRGIQVKALNQPNQYVSTIKRNKIEVNDNTLQITSGNQLLQSTLKSAKERIYSELVISPENEPRGESEPRVADHYGVDSVIPSLWGSYKNDVPANEGGNHYRECFCLRDISHQADAGHLLGLDKENFTMLHLFAKGANNNDVRGKKYWPKWSYSFYGDPYYMDAGFQELPAPFELLEKIYRQYLWTGDRKWIEDPEILEYAENLHSYDAFMAKHDVNNNGVADGGGDMGILPTLWEFEERGTIVEAGDTYGVQYQSLLAYAGILEANGKYEKGKEIRERAADLKDNFEKNWYSDEEQIYIRAFDKDGNPRTNWGHENSFFMPMKLLTDNGPRTDKYLDFIHESTILDRLNNEALTYLPEVFYKHGENAMGWHWLKEILTTKDTYPELAFLNISNTVTGMMGVEPDAPNNKIATVPRLTVEVPWVQADNIPMGQNLVSVRHDGNEKTTFINMDGNEITWEAQFYGEADTIEINGKNMRAIKKELNGKTISFVTLNVKPGQKIVAKANMNKTGFLYLSDQKWAFSSDTDKIKKDLSFKEKPIFIGSTNYQKGIGTKGNSAIKYYLDGEATRFTATVGLDDIEKKQDSGSVVFRVYADNKKVYDSGIIRLGDPAKQVDIDLTDVEILDLVTTDAGDGENKDSASWGDAKIYTNKESLNYESPDKSVYLSDLTWDAVGGTKTDVKIDTNYHDRKIWVGERTYFKGLGVYADNEIVYNLDGIYSRFLSDVGIDESVKSDGDVTYKVYGDGRLLYETGKLTTDSPVTTIDVDVTNVKELKLVVKDAGNKNNDMANWADARLVYNPSIDLDSALVVSRKIRSIKMPNIGDGHLTLPIINEGYNISIKRSSNESVVALDGTINSPDEETTVTLVLEVTRLSNGEKSQTVPIDVLIPSDKAISLTYFDWKSAEAQYGKVQLGKSNGGNSLKIGGKNYKKGIGTHAYSEIIYDIEGKYDKFTSDVGLDDETGANGSINYEVYGDGKKLYSTEVLRGADPVKTIEVDIKGVKELKLVVNNGGDNNNHDHADWGNPMLLVGEQKEVTAQSVANSIRGISNPQKGDTQIKLPNVKNGFSVRIYSSNNETVISKGGAITPASQDTSVNIVLQATRERDGKSALTREFNVVVPSKGTITEEKESKYIDELKPTKSKTGWGKVGINKSCDNNPIKLNGKVYERGLGVHADSEIIYELDGKYNRFISDIGIDDEVGNRGLVVFKVYGDGRLIYESPEMKGNSNTETIDVDIIGVDKLTLKVESPHDNISNDHADWADAKLLTSNNSDDSDESNDTEISLLELNWRKAKTSWGKIQKNKSIDKQSITIDRKVYDKGIGTHADSEIVYELNGEYKRFKCLVGIDDETGDLGSAVFKVYGDGEILFDSGITIGRDKGKNVDVNITGINELKLVVNDGGDNKNWDHADWAQPVLTR